MHRDQCCNPLPTWKSCLHVMNPAKVNRDQVFQLKDLPNIGKACAKDLHLLGIHVPADLIDQDPFEMYERLCTITGTRHDPCMLDVLISATRFMQGGPALNWWSFTEERKRIVRQRR